MSLKNTSLLYLAEKSLQSTSLRKLCSSKEIGSGIDEASVTVKFFINAEEMFTKAFRKSDTVNDIKIQLAPLFSIESQKIQLSKCEEMLSNNVRLDGLGVVAAGTIDLTVSTESPLVLNRDLIYGHIPTVDVINVRSNGGFQQVVEIEYQQLEKEWLGGYKHLVTKREYHHASTQTSADRNELQKVSRSVQIHLGNEKNLSTPISRAVQTSLIPNSQDKLLLPRVDALMEEEVFQGNSKINEPKVGMRKLYEEIIQWNRIENEKVAYMDEAKRQSRRCEILDLTRKLLTRKDRLIVKRSQTVYSQLTQEIISQAGIPKIIVNKDGLRISVDTLETQRARHLKNLYLDYRQENEKETRIKIVLELHDFFSQVEYVFNSDVLELLETELALLRKGLTGTASLKKRIEQYILHIFKQSAGKYTITREGRYLKDLDCSPYRNILISLQDDEVKVFKCFSSVCFRMEAIHMYRLVHEIWEDCSIKSECRNLNVLRMTRWQKQEEWSVSNCLLLTKPEVKDHLRTGIMNYEQWFVSKVRSNHFRAQLLFCGEFLFDEKKFLK